MTGNSEWTTVGAKKNVNKTVQENKSVRTTNVSTTQTVQENKPVKTVNVFANQLAQETKPIKTVFATGPKFYSTSESSRVEAPSKNKESSVQNVQKTFTRKELMEKKQKLLEQACQEICYDEGTIDKMLDNYYNNKVYDHKKGGLVAHLKPILMSYNNKGGIDRYAVLSSQNFQNIVTEHFSQYDLDVTFKNDSDNQVWRIFLYPQH